MNLIQLKAEILADGKVDPTEAAKLESLIMADNVVDLEEMDALFDINENATASCKEFDDLFVTAGKKCYLHDPESPGVIDEAEARHIVAAIDNDGIIDANERALLVAIRAEATSIHPILSDKMTSLGI